MHSCRPSVRDHACLRKHPPRSAWRTVELDVPTRAYRTPRIFEQPVRLAGRTFRQLFRDLIVMPATVEVTPTEVVVQFHRRAHLPIILASGRLNQPVSVLWWNGVPLRLTT